MPRETLAEIRERMQALRPRVDELISSREKTPTKQTTTSTNSQQIANIRRQVEAIQKRVASGNLSDAQRRRAIELVRKAQKQLSSIRETVGHKEREEVDEMERALEDAEKVRLPRETVNIGGVEFSLPTDLINSSLWRGANEELQSLIAYSWESISDHGRDITQIIKALDTAAQQSDAYMRQQIRMFEDGLADAFDYIIEDFGKGQEIIVRKKGEVVEDLEAQERLLSRRKAELEEDLKYHSKELDIDKQRALSQSLDRYEKKVEVTRDNLAQQGLTFSSIRGRAEKILKEAHQDIVEDIETKKRREQRQLEVSTERQAKDIAFEKEQKRVQAERAQKSLQEQLDRLKSQSQRGATNLLRKGEAEMGTDWMRDFIAGKSGQLSQLPWEASFTGGIGGDMKRKQHQDILQRAQSFLGS